MAESDDYDLEVDVFDEDDINILIGDDELRGDILSNQSPVPGSLIPSFRCDGIAAIVALALELKVPIFEGGLLGTSSGSQIRIGSGAFAIAAISRFLFTTAPDETWSSELHQEFEERFAGEKVVVKQYATGHSGSQPLALEQLGQEMRILAHPSIRENANIINIVGLHWEGSPFDEWGREHRWPLLSFEYGNCGTLQDFFGHVDIDYTWELKVSLLNDLANGLEGLDDAGVCHGDLKPANILVFRTGSNTFIAKICDFGSTVLGVDFGSDVQSVRLRTYTPPWEAPESTEEIPIDDLDKVDMYSFGLLACYIALGGQELFATASSTYGIPTELGAKQKAIKELKRKNMALEISKAIVGDFLCKYCTSVQTSALLELFENTLPADPQDRAEDYASIKTLLKPKAPLTTHHERGIEHAAEMSNYFQETLIPPYFHSDPTRSIPDIALCWKRILPKSIVAAQIFNDIKRIASQLDGVQVKHSHIPRAGKATYALAICLIQGFGCEVDIAEAKVKLIQSAEANCPTALRYIYRLLGGLGGSLPESLRVSVSEYAAMALINVSDMNQAQDLLQIEPKAYQIAMEQKRANNGPGINYFGEELWETVIPDDHEQFLDLIGRKNSEIDHPDVIGTGLTWLHYAASRGSLRAMEALLKAADCDINCITIDGGWTPLFMACQAGHYEATIFLLERNADATIRTQNGNSCLHQLYMFNPAEAISVAKRLEESDLSINIKNAQGESPLVHICSMLSGCDGFPGVTKCLVELGADPMDRSCDGYSCIDIAAMQLDSDTLNALLESRLMVEKEWHMAKAYALRVVMSTPLFHRLRCAGSSYRGKLRATFDILVTRQVIEAYKSLYPGHTPLYDACNWISLDIIPLLIQTNLCIDVLQGRHPLLVCIKCNQLEPIKMLITRESNLAAVVDSNRWNILHYTAFYFPVIPPFIITRLQKFGCDIRTLVNAGCSLRGRTPFDVAVEAENFECASELLKYGAQYTDFTRRGDMDDWFGEHVRFSSLQLGAISTRRLGYLLGLDKKPSLIASSSGLTLFHLTAAQFEVEWSYDDTSPAKNIGFLLDFYASSSDAEQPDEKGTTPLHLAALMLNATVVEALIELANVEVNPVDNSGRTPLDLLEMYLPGRLEHFKDHPFIGKELRKLIPQDDMDRKARDSRLKAVKALLERHGAVRSKDLG